MPLSLRVPIFDDLVPGAFLLGANYVVEFEANSIWYETSLTIAVQALRGGLKTQYHTFAHIPTEIRRDLGKLGVDSRQLETEDRFRLIDGYTRLTGLPIQPEPATLFPGRSSRPLNDPAFLETYTANIADLFRTGALDKDKGWLHIDDNTSIFNRYFKEEDVLNLFHTKIFPETRFLELSVFHSVVSGVFSEGFYRQMETLCDGVIDFKTEENDGSLENYVRIRTLRGKTFNSKWRRLQLTTNGEVTLDSSEKKKGHEIGISGWLKGPRKK